MPADSNNPNTRVGAMAPDASTSPVDWGPEIRVNNCKPDGLAKDWTPVWWTDGEVQHVSTTDRLVWTQERVPLKAIRLPTGHPYYSKVPTTPERDPALWDRMEALVRDIGEHSLQTFVYSGDATALNGWIVKARGIVADLPKPVDPDEREVRNILSTCGWVDDDASYDAAQEVAREALRRGRELAGEQA